MNPCAILNSRIPWHRKLQHRMGFMYAICKCRELLLLLLPLPPYINKHFNCTKYNLRWDWHMNNGKDNYEVIYTENRIACIQISNLYWCVQWVLQNYLPLHQSYDRKCNVCGYFMTFTLRVYGRMAPKLFLYCSI